MNRLPIVVAALAAFLALATPANASPIGPGGYHGPNPTGGGTSGGIDPPYFFTYSDLAGDIGYGTLDATNSGLGDGSLLVTGGTLILTASSDGNGSIGTYSLIPEGPGAVVSPSGLFAVDDLIYPANNAANGVNPNISGNPSYLTNWGLLFGQPGTGSQNEVNIYANGGGDYALWSEAGGSYNITNSSGGTFALVALPEPASLTLLGLGAAAIAVYSRRRKVAVE
jgi:hypothetical protein